VLAIDILKWPGMNQAFIVSFIITMVLTLAVIPYGKRRPPSRGMSWGEAMLGALYAFFVMFLAYGIVPHQWLTHVQNELGWRADKLVLGPGSTFRLAMRSSLVSTSSSSASSCGCGAGGRSVEP
jgi:hypothetical protein